MYNIKALLNKDREVKNFFKEHFADFFSKYDYQSLESEIRYVEINSYNDLQHVRYGAGLYFILTNYEYDVNSCGLEVKGLKVIYRGHGVRIRKRVESHIYKNRYMQNPDGTTYKVCMKLDDSNGINIDTSPYSEYLWAVIYHPMTHSTKTMREQAELAFDEAYNMPFGSKA